MKRSASKAELSSEEKEPLENPVDKSDAVGDSDLVVVESDTVEPTQAGLGLESCGLQDGEKGALQVNSGVAVQPAQAGLRLESHSLQEQQPSVEAVAIQANSGVAVQPTQADLRLESHSFQEQPNIEEGAIQVNSGVLPTQAGFRLEPYSFQEQPNVEEGAIQANCGVAVQPTQAGLGLEFHSFQEQPNVEARFILASSGIPSPSNLEVISVYDLHDILHPLVEERDLLEEILQIATGQVEASHQEEEAGINDRTVPQAPPSDMDNLRNVGWIELADLEEPIDGEEDTGIQAQAGRQQMQDEPPQQGTAGRRMRLQVSSLHSATDYKGSILGLQRSDATSSCKGLCASFSEVPFCEAKGLSEPKCVLIASSERTCMCDGMSLEQEASSSCSLSHTFTTHQSMFDVTCQLNPAEFLCTEPADLLHGDATGSSARVTMQEEGDTKGSLCAEGLISCVTKSDNPDVAQQTAQDVSGSSSTSFVLLLLGLIGEACILPAFAAELSKETEEEMNFGSEDRFNGRGCSETELEGRQSMVSHINNTRPYLQQRMTPSSSLKVTEITKTQLEIAHAVSNEERRKRCMGSGSGLAPCLFWIATLALILLCLFRSFCRLTRMSCTSV